MNRLTNVAINGVAMADVVGVESFTPQKDATASSLARFTEGEVGPTVQVQVTTLDAYVDATTGVRGLDAMKVDVEGAELAVLRGA